MPKINKEMDQSIIQIANSRPNVKNQLIYSFLTLLLVMTLLPSFSSFSPTNKSNSFEGIQRALEVPDINLSEEPITSLKLESQSQENNPELIFPTFLYNSIEIANLMIQNLFDNDSNTFYFSIDEEWQQTSINPGKRTFDNAQAILALLKLADAVINDTERNFALEMANKTSNGLVSTFWDNDFGGYFISDADHYKKPGNQGKAIQAFVALYEKTGNPAYRDLAIDAFNFVDSTAWNDTIGYYRYITSHTGLQLLVNPYDGDPFEPESLRVDHNAIMGNALLDLHRMESNETYLTKAIQIYDIMNTTCRNNVTYLYHSGINSKQEIVLPESTDIFINSLVLEFLAKLYNATEDTTYYDDFFPLLNSVLLHFWDNNNGGFIATSSTINSTFDDTMKFTERQFYGLRALDEAYKLTNSLLYYNFILDTIEVLNDNLYDQINGGYYQLSNPDGTQSGIPSWRKKSTVTQSLAIFSLSNLWLYTKPSALNVLWSPSTPLPDDEVTFLIAAFDSAGISSVFLNYSINGEAYELLEMVPHSVGNMYNVTLDPPHPDGTTISFNIIINNTLNVQAIRGQYSFLWQSDRWSPDVELLGILPGNEIPVNEEFSIFVSAQDVPSQGIVKRIRIHYSLPPNNEESLLLEQIDTHIWKITFPDGLPKPGIYSYYFESWDFYLNPGFSHVNKFAILGVPVVPDFSAVLGILFFFGAIVPLGLYTYVEYKKKSARKTLKGIRRVNNHQRTRQLRKRGTKRT